MGIYKITNPENEVYIGQSIDIKRRFKEHKSCKKYTESNKLYNSLQKYDIKNHVFEVIEECEFLKLNERERYWQDFYNETNSLLNVQFTQTENKNGYYIEYHKRLLKKPKKLTDKEYNFYVLDTQTGIYYNTISEASMYQISSDRIIRRMLLGWRKNTTNLILV